MPYPIFDRSRLRILPLSQRIHDMTLDDVLPLGHPGEPFEDPALPVLAERIRRGRQAGASVIVLMGAHVIKTGLSRFVIDLMERGLISHVGLNGAGVIHDFELALVGASTESVARYIRTGEFGLWQETGEINDIIPGAAGEGLGLGEAIGRQIEKSNFPHKHLSILAAAYRHRLPATVHVGIGYDIIHEHPNCDGAALGATSYRDFLVFTESVSRLEGGVLLCFGSAVMGPEVYLKALAMSRNVAHQTGNVIQHFTTAVFDLIPMPGDFREEADKSNPQYYYRPWKTILVRTVADGGESFYFCGDHRATFPALHHLVVGSKS